MRRPEQSRGATVRRRLRTVPPMYVGFVVVTVLLIPLLVVALLIDLARRKLVALRLALFLWLFLLAEAVGITVLFLSWVFLRGEPLIDATYAVQRRWTGFLWGSLRRLFGLRVRLEGTVDGPGPVIVLIRHASIIDNLIPANFVDLRLRYLIKRELLAEPCLDIAGSRLPNAFVARESGGDEKELAAVRALAEHMTLRDGVLIYPEGTRFSPERLERSRAKLAEAGMDDLAAKAQQLRHLLPPRVGGPLALLQAAPEADVVVLGHTGLDGVTYIRNIWAGGLTGSTIAVRIQRFARATLPTDRDAQIAWVYDRWIDMDHWIGQQT